MCIRDRGFYWELLWFYKIDDLLENALPIADMNVAPLAFERQNKICQVKHNTNNSNNDQIKSAMDEKIMFANLIIFWRKITKVYPGLQKLSMLEVSSVWYKSVFVCLFIEANAWVTYCKHIADAANWIQYASAANNKTVRCLTPLVVF